MRREARPLISEFYDYWDRKRRGRALPSRADLDPVEMKRWLSGIQIVEVLENPRRLQYRLLGQNEIDARGFNATGLPVEEGFICASKEDALANYNRAIDGRTMVFDWSPIPHAGGFYVDQQAIFLPLSTNGVDVDRVITFSIILR